MESNKEEKNNLETLTDSVASKKRGHDEELIDHYWGSLSYITGLIKSSEIKAGLILSFYGILFNFIYRNLDMVMLQAKEYNVFYVLLVIWLITTIVSIFFSVRCFMPRIEGKYDKNIFFFNDVLTKFGDIKEFSKTFYDISRDQDELFLQLGEQIYVNSKIAALKFKYVNRSTFCLQLV